MKTAIKIVGRAAKSAGRAAKKASKAISGEAKKLRAKERAIKTTRAAAGIKSYQLSSNEDRQRQVLARKMLKGKGYLRGTEQEIFFKYGELANFYQPYTLDNKQKRTWGMVSWRVRGIKTKRYELGLRPTD